MARCEVIRQVQPITEVVLRLSEEEAVALRVVLGNVGGDGELRRATDSVWQALRDQRVGPGLVSGVWASGINPSLSRDFQIVKAK